MSIDAPDPVIARVLHQDAFHEFNPKPALQPSPPGTPDEKPALPHNVVPSATDPHAGLTPDQRESAVAHGAIPSTRDLVPDLFDQVQHLSEPEQSSPLFGAFAETVNSLITIANADPDSAAGKAAAELLRAIDTYLRNGGEFDRAFVTGFAQAADGVVAMATATFSADPTVNRFILRVTDGHTSSDPIRERNDLFASGSLTTSADED